MINRFFISIMLLLSIHSFAQVGIGHWRDHLPYAKTIAVTEGDNTASIAQPLLEPSILIKVIIVLLA